MTEESSERASLADTHPHVASQAVGWDPSEFTYGSSKKKTWKCEKGHVWDAIIASRTRGNQGCPFCSNRRVLAGFNDLATKYPEVANQAVEWDPSTITPGNEIKRKWKCNLGHIFIATSMDRTGKGKTGCPFCAHQKLLKGFNDLRTTHPRAAKEAYGWDPSEYISGSSKKKTWKCEKGHISETSIFNRSRAQIGCPYCNNTKVLPGFNDLKSKYPEIAKEAYLWDPENTFPTSNKVAKWKCEEGHIYSSRIYSRTSGGNNCPICSNQEVSRGVNDLATTHPNIAKEAHNWDPSEVTYGSEVKKNWICTLGHVYLMSPNARTSENGNKGCPYCSSRKLLTGFNDLQTKFPNIAVEAHGWDPTSLIAGSAKKMDWKCEKGHIYSASLDNRTKGGTGCPSCTQFGYDPNKDAYLYFLSHPEWELLQIGITNVPDIRLASHKRLGWELLELRGPMDGYLCQEWESAILKMLAANGAELASTAEAGRFDGYTEAWKKQSFNVKSLKKLMELTDEFEERRIK